MRTINKKRIIALFYKSNTNSSIRIQPFDITFQINQSTLYQGLFYPSHGLRNINAMPSIEPKNFASQSCQVFKPTYHGTSTLCVLYLQSVIKGNSIQFRGLIRQIISSQPNVCILTDCHMKTWRDCNMNMSK